MPLSDSQAEALQEFSRLCTEHGLLNRPQGLGEDDLQYGLTDEATLLRFLKARSFDVQGALKQFKESAAAHHDNRVTELYDEIDVELFEEIKSIYPHWSGRLNKRGLPIFIIDIVNFDGAAIKSYGKSRNINPVSITHSSTDAEKPVATGGAVSLTGPQRALIYFDYMIRFIVPFCSIPSQNHGDESTKTEKAHNCIYLVDIATLGLKQVWDMRNYAQDASRLLAINYPEVVDRIYVVNAPSYYNTIWGIIKRFIDPATAAKLIIVPPSQVFETLSKDIDIENIPKAYGGEFEYQHAMDPSLDERIRHNVNWNTSDTTTVPPGPIKWVRDGDSMKAVAVGRTNGESRRLDVCSVTLPAAAEASSRS